MEGLRWRGEMEGRDGGQGRRGGMGGVGWVGRSRRGGVEGRRVGEGEGGGDKIGSAVCGKREKRRAE